MARWICAERLGVMDGNDYRDRGSVAVLTGAALLQGEKAAALCRKPNDELAGIVQSDSALLQPLAPASRGGTPAADQAIPDGHGCRRARLARVDAILLDQERAFAQISALRCDTI